MLYIAVQKETSFVHARSPIPITFETDIAIYFTAAQIQIKKK